MNSFLNGVITGVIGSVIATILISLVLSIKNKMPSLLNLYLFFPSPLKKSGFVKAYKNFSSALPAMRKCLESTRSARILSNRGDEWFGSHTSGLSKDIEDRTKSQGSLALKICLLRSSIPWLEEHYKDSNDVGGKKRFFNVTHALVEGFLDKNKSVLDTISKVYYHSEVPCWRMFITDDRLFISSYADKGKAREATVLSFRGPDTPFYNAALRYFDALCAKNSATTYPVVQDMKEEPVNAVKDD